MTLAVALLGAAGAAIAQQSQDAAWCSNPKSTDDQTIAGCTGLILSGRESPHNLAVDYTNRGYAFAGKGNYDRAIEDYDAAIQIEPQYENAYVGRASAWSHKGDYDRAIADDNEAIRLDPNDSIAYFNRGNHWDNKREYDRAIADYDQALRIDPRYVKAYTNRGYAYTAKGEFDRAIADYGAAIRLDPKHVTAFTGRGDAYFAKGDYDTAIAVYTAAIRIDPRQAFAYRNRGIARLFDGDLSSALADLNQANSINGSDEYTLLWIDIANARSYSPSPLAGLAAQTDLNAWPGPLIRLYLGKTTPEAVLAAADNPNALTKSNRVCDANFYAGELALQRGEKDEAARLFRLALAGCPKDVVEWMAANAELKQLGVH